MAVYESDFSINIVFRILVDVHKSDEMRNKRWRSAETEVL